MASCPTLATGSAAAAALHVARTVCRRAERSMVKYKNLIQFQYKDRSSFKSKEFDPVRIKFLNRFSDFLFVIARILNIGHQEPIWKHQLSLREPNE